MLTPLAFLQLTPDEIARVDGPLEPVPAPRDDAPAFFAPDFALKAERPWWVTGQPAAVQRLSIADWARRHPLDEAASTLRLPWSSPDVGRFSRAFRSLQPLLDRGTLRKGVPSTMMSAPVAATVACQVFERAMARVPLLPRELFAYGFFNPGDAAGHGPEFMIGATPEMLFEIEAGRRLATMAVAGTRPSAAGPELLDASAKDHDEHASVVEDLMAQLERWGSPSVSKTEVRPFGQLEHLAADVMVESRVPLDFETVSRTLHPTPALGVYPRSPVGVQWLAGTDPGGERKRFGAPFGFRLSSGDGRCLVAIRNLQYRDGRLEIWAGCGVVPQSCFDEEWQEVLDKMQAVRALWDV
jgi:menaquinone-specific isochorismate synthase